MLPFITVLNTVINKSSRHFKQAGTRKDKKSWENEETTGFEHVETNCMEYANAFFCFRLDKAVLFDMKEHIYYFII